MNCGKGIALAAVLLTAVGATSAGAAQLRICYKLSGPNVLDTAKVRLYIGPIVAADDLQQGLIVPDVPVCADIIIPTQVVRGQSQPYTLRAVNSLGEEGPASNAITFRTPLVPGAPSAVSVGAALP